MGASSRRRAPGANAGSPLNGDGRQVKVDVAPDARLDVTPSDLEPWLRSRPFGGRANGTATIGGESWVLEGRSRFWEMEVAGHAQSADALVLPVPREAAYRRRGGPPLEGLG